MYKCVSDNKVVDTRLHGDLNISNGFGGEALYFHNILPPLVIFVPNFCCSFIHSSSEVQPFSTFRPFLPKDRGSRSGCMTRLHPDHVSRVFFGFMILMRSDFHRSIGCMSPKLNCKSPEMRLSLDRLQIIMNETGSESRREHDTQAVFTAML